MWSLLVSSASIVVLPWSSCGSASAAAVPPLLVRGNRVTVGGDAVSLGGTSLFWSNNGWGGEKFYTRETVAWLKSDWRSSIVRAAMGVEDPGGYFDDPAGNEAKVRTVVEAAITNDMYVIIDWHSHHAHEHDWARAIEFFERMALDYGHHGNVIYEIYNEPIRHVSWSEDIKPYAVAVVQAIRDVDPDNLIVVGTPQWSQLVEEASRDPLDAYNIAYTLHFYAGSHGQWLRDEAQAAMANGIALFATEWATSTAFGTGGVTYGNLEQWMDFLRNNNLSHVNWAVNDKSETASALKPGASPGGSWTADDLTESGQFVRDALLNWSKEIHVGDDLTDCTTFTVGVVIEAEHYCSKSPGVKTQPTTDEGGGVNMGWISEGHWLKYRVNIPSAGRYDIEYRVASLRYPGKFWLYRDNDVLLDYVEFNTTGGWQDWTTVVHSIDLEQPGISTLTLRACNTDFFNFNWLRMNSVSER
jgi:endoglucanase